MLKIAEEIVAELKVLIVDDNAEMCKLIKGMLRDLGLTQSFVANSGHEAMKFFSATTPGDAMDVVVCDWNMPGMTGIELLLQVRAIKPDLPFLMITGNTGKDFVVEAAKHGVTNYIVKPFSPAVLHKKLSIIARILAKRRVNSPAN